MPCSIRNWFGCLHRYGCADARHRKRYLCLRLLAFNVPACEPGLARVALAMGAETDAQAAIESVRRLSAEVGIPARLREVGVTHAFVPQMARDAFESGNSQVVNPRKPSLSEVVALHEQAL
ncbi:MAG: iron-containing alcohol dehydrogenase [Anaerolineae bacterium]